MGVDRRHHPAEVKDEMIINHRYYHTIKEVKNGEDRTPSAPPKGGCTWRTEYADVPPDCAMCSICI